jgi:hypothetical protein
VGRIIARVKQFSWLICMAMGFLMSTYPTITKSLDPLLTDNFEQVLHFKIELAISAMNIIK